MKLIKVTDTEGNEIYINPEEVVAIKSYSYAEMPVGIALSNQWLVTVTGTKEEWAERIMNV